MDENMNEKDAEFEEVKENASCCKNECSHKRNEKNSDMSIFVLGLLGVILPLWNPMLSLVGFVLALIAVIKGHKVRKSGSVSGLVRAGFTLGIMSLVIAGVNLVFGLSFTLRFITPYHYFYRTFWF